MSVTISTAMGICRLPRPATPSHDMHISRYSGEKHRQKHCHLFDKIRVSTSVACVYRGRVPTVRSADHDLTESS